MNCTWNRTFRYCEILFKIGIKRVLSNHRQLERNIGNLWIVLDNPTINTATGYTTTECYMYFTWDEPVAPMVARVFTRLRFVSNCNKLCALSSHCPFTWMTSTPFVASSLSDTPRWWKRTIVILNCWHTRIPRYSSNSEKCYSVRAPQLNQFWTYICVIIVILGKDYLILCNLWRTIL